MTTDTKTPAPKWAAVGMAHMCGLGAWVDLHDGRTLALGAEDLARLIDEGEPATLHEIDPTGAAEPRPVGTADLSLSGRTILLMVDGEAYTGMQLPAQHFLAHYRRADRAPVAVMAPPTPTLAVAA